MNKRLIHRHARILGTLMLLGASAHAQDHRWAGRQLDDFEWAIHERLATLPFHGVFDTLDFAVQGKTVILSGQVVKGSVKERAERAVKRIDGVETVVNRIEVLPSSRRDDALRVNLYRAIYQDAAPAEYDGGSPAFVHIIVKDGAATLEGVVNSDADRSAIHVRALNVTAHVNDKLRVSSQP
jgi:hypothetical protein